MKKLSLVLALLVLIIAGCTKKYYYGSDGANNPAFIVQGISDFEINEVTFPVSISLSVIYNSGEQENVRLSIENLPAGLYADMPLKSGIPSYSSFVTFTDSNAVPGTYTVNLVATGAISGRKVFPFTVVVTPTPDCRDNITGSFTVTNFCAVGPSNFSANVVEDATHSDRVIFKNWENTGADIYGEVDCRNQEIEIPSQTVNGMTYKGSGNFFTSGGMAQVRIEYDRSSPTTGTTPCLATLRK